MTFQERDSDGPTLIPVFESGNGELKPPCPPSPNVSYIPDDKSKSNKRVKAYSMAGFIMLLVGVLSRQILIYIVMNMKNVIDHLFGAFFLLSGIGYFLVLLPYISLNWNRPEKVGRKPLIGFIFIVLSIILFLVLTVMGGMDKIGRDSYFEGSFSTGWVCSMFGFVLLYAVTFFIFYLFVTRLSRKEKIPSKGLYWIGMIGYCISGLTFGLFMGPPIFLGSNGLIFMGMLWNYFTLAKYKYGYIRDIDIDFVDRM